ncbi:helix-turn-helix domain-containing protein [Dokdonia ponticola]|uniref:Helix-turn-helix domain-containing protein n=1 Tax=Dokdonia ponticola TaxID=2041041 RepID=A0ABV9I516_9FLAO
MDLLPHIVMIVLMIGGFLGLLGSLPLETVSNAIDTYTTYIDIPRWLSLVIYLWMSYTLWKRTPVMEKETASAKWAKRFLLGFTVFSGIWLLHLIPYTLPSLSQYLLGTVGWYPVYIPLVILVYWLGINGYIIGYKTVSKSATTSLSTTDIEHTVTTLNMLMEEAQWFLKPTLKLQEVVTHTGISQKTISAVLNQHLGKSFNEYVNTYRINEFKKRLLDPSHAHLTITGIAFECGFNSQATFQRVFKSLTGQSPKEYRKG